MNSYKRLKLDLMFLRIAKEMANLSHCVSHQVGSILVFNDRIISTGWNGTPAGNKNCDEVFDSGNFDRQKHHEWSNIHEVHGELNCLMFAARNGIKTEGATIYSTLQPCIHCAKTMIQAGIIRVVYSKVYDKNVSNIESEQFLKASNVLYEQIDE